MLKAIKSNTVHASGGTFAIVASRYNAEYVDAMLHAATTELRRAGAKVQVVRVPGEFEMPGVGGGEAGGGCPLLGVLLLGIYFSGRDEPRATHWLGCHTRAGADPSAAQAAGRPRRVPV